MVQSVISVTTLTRTSKPNQNQNQCHSDAATQAAGVESIVIVNQVCIGSNWLWQSNKTFRTYVITIFFAFERADQNYRGAIADIKEGGSIYPAKYTSWPCLMLSSNSAAMLACNRSHNAIVTLSQHSGSAKRFLH
jgi:hypothetical protein